MSGTLAERLIGKRKVHFDTVALIYFIEKNPKYLPLVLPAFRLIAEDQLEGFSSIISLLEVLVKPIAEGKLDLAHEYREVLLRSPNFGLFAVDERIAEAGAEIRARFSFKTPDAIQLATARRNGAEAFVTNDHELRRFDQVEVLVLDDFLGATPLISGGI